MAILDWVGAAGADFDDLLVGDLLLGDVISATPTQFILRDGAWQDAFTGQFTYANGRMERRHDRQLETEPVRADGVRDHRDPRARDPTRHLGGHGER